MRRKRKALTPDVPLAPVPAEIVDQFVAQGSISHEELDAAVRRFKKATIERALVRARDDDARNSRLPGRHGCGGGLARSDQHGYRCGGRRVTAWQSRPLEGMSPVVFFDALRVNIRDEATVRSKAILLALAVLPDASRDILGLWIQWTPNPRPPLLGKPHRMRFPTAPTRNLVFEREEERTNVNALHTRSSGHSPEGREASARLPCR
jgi:hypothetical protein